MLLKKHLSVKQILFPISVGLLCLLVLLQQSCKKTDFDTVESEKSNVNKTEQFFKLPANVNSALQRVAEELKRQNTSKEFIEEFIAKQGFAIWNKASIFVKADNTNTPSNNSTTPSFGDLSGLSDTTIYIPLVLDNAKQVNAFIKAIVTDTVSMRLFKNNDYENLPFQTPAPPTVTTAENYALRMMQMDNDVFGYTTFDIKDKRLFNNNTDYRDTGEITRGVNFTNTTNNVTANGFTINSVLHVVCVTISNTTYIPTETGCTCSDPSNCDLCSVCVTTSTTYNMQCETWFDNSDESGGSGWPIIPSGGGGGGGVGGVNPPPCSVMGPIVSTNNPVAGCPPAPSVWPTLPPNVLQLRSILGLNTSMTNWLVLNPSVANIVHQSLLESLIDEDPATGQAYMDYFSTESIAASKATIAAAMNNYIGASFNTEHYNCIKNFIPNSENHPNINPALLGQYFSFHCIIIHLEHPEWSQTKVYWNAIKELIHTGLDVAGLFPIVGEIADLANGIIYTIEGDGVNATLSFAATIPIAGWGVTASKYAKKAITALDGSTRTLKWVKQTNNIINFGDRGLLRKVLGLASGDARIAHHLIPWEHGVDDLVQKAASGDFHLNEILNGIPLTAIQHNGSHNIYNDRVKAYLVAIKNSLVTSGQFNPQTARSAIETLINNVIKPAILNNPNIPINQIVF